MKRSPPAARTTNCIVSVLNREPMGMKHRTSGDASARAVVSVLNREPMGMKPRQRRSRSPQSSPSRATSRAAGGFLCSHYSPFLVPHAMPPRNLDSALKPCQVAGGLLPHCSADIGLQYSDTSRRETLAVLAFHIELRATPSGGPFCARSRPLRQGFRFQLYSVVMRRGCDEAMLSHPRVLASPPHCQAVLNHVLDHIVAEPAELAVDAWPSAGRRIWHRLPADRRLDRRRRRGHVTPQRWCNWHPHRLTQRDLVDPA